jgi:hypothetical protein
MAPLPPPSQPTVDAIFRAYESASRDGFREHLGASLIGHECDRHLWYSFRWVRRAQHAGRLLRLFETGQLEETRLIRNLRAAGVTVMDVDPATGRQWAMKACAGHFGGSADAIAIGIHEAPKAKHVCEFKTHNAKSFAALQKHGLAKHKPQHLAQLQIYMHLLGAERGFYLAVCKNDDSLYSERVHPDPVAAERLLAKAEAIINAPSPPAKLSEDADYFLCRWCDHKDICHGEERAERNCRTCLHASPVADGKWHCAARDIFLSARNQRAGCMSTHRYIPDLVAGEQTDVRGDAVVYRMRDGAEWVDAGT